MSKLHLVRHGQTEWNSSGRIQGTTDTDLAAEGLLQAEHFAMKLQRDGVPIGRVYSSWQKRAFQTAEAIATELGVEVRNLPGVHELNFGLWEGLTWPQVEERFLSEYQNWSEDRRYHAAPSGEANQQMLERVVPALESALEQARRDSLSDVLVVTHGMVITSLRCLIEEQPFENWRSLRVGNGEAVTFNEEQLQKAGRFLRSGTAKF